MNNYKAKDNHPRVSIGLPVYNGENYLAEAIDSILAQTFTDLELLISDNASTDRTEAICRAYAAQDERVIYVRNEKNMGASYNYNRLVPMARGEYFKWGAHDDLITPDFLQRCVDVLDADESIVLCYPLAQAIDENGDVVKVFPPKPGIDSYKVPERFYECVVVPHSQNAVFGVIRTNQLRQTQLIGNYSSSDRTLLGELILLGRFYEIQDVLFYKRHHPQQHWQVHKSSAEKQVWYDPRNRGKRTHRTWRLLQEHLRAIHKTSMSSSDRIRCYSSMLWWIRYNWRYLFKDIVPQKA